VAAEDKSQSLEEACLAKGMRMTEQRRVVARVLEAATDHPDVEELYRRAADVDPHISLATVYRTMKALEESGAIQRHAFGHGPARFEQAQVGHHDHLIDVDTGEVIEFTSQRIEAIQQEIAARLGYQIVHHRLELYGRKLKAE
jgi:Fur family ferric uptake transcriptional regulator